MCSAKNWIFKHQWCHSTIALQRKPKSTLREFFVNIMDPWRIVRLVRNKGAILWIRSTSAVGQHCCYLGSETDHLILCISDHRRSPYISKYKYKDYLGGYHEVHIFPWYNHGELWKNYSVQMLWTNWTNVVKKCRWTDIVENFRWTKEN